MLKNRRNLELEQSWRVHLQQQLTSGFSIAEYCRQQSLSAIQFYFWKRTIMQREQEIISIQPKSFAGKAEPMPSKSSAGKRQVAPKVAAGETAQASAPVNHQPGAPTSKEAEPPAFIPVVFQHLKVPQYSDTPIEIILSGQQTIRVRAGCDRQLLAEIVHLLGESSC